MPQAPCKLHKIRNVPHNCTVTQVERDCMHSKSLSHIQKHRPRMHFHKQSLCVKVRLWNLQSGTCDVTLSGHKGQVTALKYNQQGGLLASGAQDTDIIVWDVAAESGLYRLRGHQDQITDLVCCTITFGVACSLSTYLLQLTA